MNERTTERASATAPAPNWGSYLMWLGGLALLLYLLPFLLIRLPGFDRWSTSPYGRELEYGMTAAHVDADVVIYGDSTALYGLDPRQMSAQLGVKVLNLPNVLPSLRVTNGLALTHYLTENKRPQLIVLYLSPWDLDYSDFRSSEQLYDGDEMLLRHGSAHDIYAFYRVHPTEYLKFPFMFYRVNSPMGIRRLAGPRPVPAVAADAGHMNISGFNPLPPDCTLPASLLPRQLAMRSAQELLYRFNTSQTRAVIYLAPIPGCRHASEVATENYSPLHAAGPRVLAPQDIVRDGRYAHPLRESVGEVTEQLVDSIRPLLRPGR